MLQWFSSFNGRSHTIWEISWVYLYSCARIVLNVIRLICILLTFVGVGAVRGLRLIGKSGSTRAA